MPVEFRTGRPPRWTTCLDLASDCELYFEHCKEEKEHPAIMGLCVYLDIDRVTLFDYGKKPDFANIIKKVKARVEAYIEQRLFEGQVVGPIFNLKCNFGWRDVQTIEQSGPDGGAIKTETKWTVEIVSPDKEK
jgi:hypothetical protein